MKGLRRRLVVLAGFAPVLLASTSRAEEPALSWGLKAGVNLSSASFSPDLPPGLAWSGRTGFIGGAFADLRLAGPLSVQLETFYTQKGIRVTAMNEMATYRLDYIELPLTLRATFGSGAFRPYLFAGPNVGFRLSADISTTGGTVDFSDQTKSTDFALDLGGGFLVRLNPKMSLLLDMRYSLGLVNIVSTGSAGDSYKSRDFKILTGVRFTIP